MESDAERLRDVSDGVANFHREKRKPAIILIRPASRFDTIMCQCMLPVCVGSKIRGSRG